MTENTQTMEQPPVQTALTQFIRDDRAPVRSGTDGDALVSRIEFHENLTPLLEQGAHVVAPTDLVLAPVDLHRRTIKHRLADADRLRDSLRLCGPADVATALLDGPAGDPPGTVDRIDRIPLLETLLQEHTEIADRFRVVFGVPPADSVKAVEQARREIETVTGYHPHRLDAIRTWCRQNEQPAAADAGDVLEATVAIERRLRRRTDRLTSKEALVRQASRDLSRRGAELWYQRFATIKRVWLCGLSTISATRADLLTSLLTTTDVDVHVTSRHASGAILRERLPGLLGIDEPGAEVFADR
jgi:ATP-dependent helicase/nuclease subunit B